MKQQPYSPDRIWSLPFVLVILISQASTGIVDALQAALPVLIKQTGGSSTLGGLTVTVFALAVKRTPKERWGAANATCYLCVDLGFGTVALFGGIAIDFLGFDRALCAGCLAAVIPAVLGLIFLRSPQPETK